MRCRDGCGACCIAASIVTPFYGMPGGKPANVRCVHLDEALRCLIFSDPRRPKCCADFKAEVEVCGDTREQALATLALIELESTPRSSV